jgi:hypothetical protein
MKFENIPDDPAGLGSDSPRRLNGFVTGGVASTLRLEGAVAMIAAILVYRALGGSWLLFAVLFFVPDLSMLGYFFNSRIGAITYNIGHSYISPAALALIGFISHRNGVYPLSALWCAHIGFDRMFGYGLKYPERFGDTHLGLKGKKAAQ